MWCPEISALQPSQMQYVGWEESEEPLQTDTCHIFKHGCKYSLMTNMRLDDSQVLDYFESVMRRFVAERLAGVDDWWNACIPPEIREDASKRYRQTKTISNVLNKPDYSVIDYINFDGYEKIISRRDNWKNHFGEVFSDKAIFDYKMRVILSLRNDVRHGRPLNSINSIRIRLHCYDILMLIHNAGFSGIDDSVMVRFGLD